MAKKYPYCPSRLSGTVEISTSREGILIAGDPKGLKSLAKLILWCANAPQEDHPTMPDGEREHVHLYATGPCASLTEFSKTTQICRLDAKGTGEFPDYYRTTKKGRPKSDRPKSRRKA